jgi:hypothetical protein
VQGRRSRFIRVGCACSRRLDSRGAGARWNGDFDREGSVRQPTVSQMLPDAGMCRHMGRFSPFSVGKRRASPGQADRSLESATPGQMNIQVRFPVGGSGRAGSPPALGERGPRLSEPRVTRPARLLTPQISCLCQKHPPQRAYKWRARRLHSGANPQFLTRYDSTTHQPVRVRPRAARTCSSLLFR